LLQDHYDTICYVDSEINVVTEKMQPATADDPVVKHLLCQFGVGIVTAGTMRAIIGHFERFRTGKQLAHFCAVCPRNDSSAGKTTTGGLIKAGDDLLRQVLVETAHRLMRFDPYWRSMADRLRANGKKTCVIVAAVANRWIRRLFHQMVEFKSVGGVTLGFSRHMQESTIATKTPSDATRRSTRGTRRAST
jgi:transposase